MKKKIISAVISALCVALCLFVSIEVIVASNQSRPPSFFGYSISYVPTKSMEPEIKAGDYIVFEKIDYRDVEIHDIVVYRSNNGEMAGNFIVHRVVEKHEDYLITKGDNNSSVDLEHVTSEMVFGKYVMTVNILGFFSGGASRGVVFFVLIFIFILLIGLQIVSIILKYRKDKLIEDNNKEKELLLEKLRKEILEEELQKIRNESKK